jgi:hypothetical protein
MAYYAYLKFEIAANAKIDREKADNLEKLFASNDANVAGFRNVKIETDLDENLIDIELDEYWGDFSDAELFAKKLQECLKSGFIDLHFENDDNEDKLFRIFPNRIEKYQKEWVYVGKI